MGVLQEHRRLGIGTKLLSHVAETAYRNDKVRQRHQIEMFLSSTRRRKSSTPKLKQVTRGHNIVADGWAGVSNSHLHPNT